MRARRFALILPAPLVVACAGHEAAPPVPIVVVVPAAIEAPSAPSDTAEARSAPIAAPSAPAGDGPSFLATEVEHVKCGSEAVSISIPRTSDALTCKDGWHDCTGKIPVTIENCLGVDATVAVSLRLSSSIGERVVGFTEMPAWPPIAAGTRVTALAPVKVGGTYTPEVRATTARAVHMVTGAAGTLENPAYVAAEKACKACNGEWGAHGILQMDGCICRAKDGGKVCHDGDECEAGCVFVGAESLGGGLGRRVGKCSEFVGGFGCVSYIDPGESKLPPRPMSEVGSATNQTCAD